MTKFKCGDVVTLKSGGPKMTVFAVNPEEKKYILCFFREVAPAIWGIYDELEQIPEDVLDNAGAVDMMREDSPSEFPEEVLGIA